MMPKVAADWWLVLPLEDQHHIADRHSVVLNARFGEGISTNWLTPWCLKLPDNQPERWLSILKTIQNT